jgi:hypothetical protein
VIVMTAVGTIALAGVVVNNNIVLIDTYVHLRSEGWDKLEAVLETCRERVRPVMLTAVTAILGVLPIAFGVNLALLSPRNDDRRAVDAVVDRAVERHRLRSRLLDHADAGRDAGGADGVHPRQCLDRRRAQPACQAVPPQEEGRGGTAFGYR